MGYDSWWAAHARVDSYRYSLGIGVLLSSSVVGVGKEMGDRGDN